MFYANFLFTCGFTITLLSIYTCQPSNYRTFMMIAGIIAMFIGTVAGLKIEYDNCMKKILQESRFKELESLVEAQSKQIQSLREEIDTLKRR